MRTEVLKANQITMRIFKNSIHIYQANKLNQFQLLSCGHFEMSLSLASRVTLAATESPLGHSPLCGVFIFFFLPSINVTIHCNE